jgi:hypothetical protein
MSTKRLTRLESLKIKAKLLQKAKKKAGAPITLKKALDTLAKLNGFLSWRDLHENLSENPFEHLLSPAQWSTWYSSYEQAKKHLKESDGYLLPYQKQFFIADENLLREFGLRPDDPDLLKVGRNWAEPQDAKAWQNLRRKLQTRQK